MTNEEKRLLILVAFSRHVRDLHNADFEVCNNPACREAYALEKQMREDKGAAAPTGAPSTATDAVLEQFRTRWRRWLGNKTRRDMPTWTTLLDSNWMGWVGQVDQDYIPLRLEDTDRESVKALWLTAIDAATMDDLRQLDALYAAEKVGL